jgi:organic radical activating enzyme
MRINEIFYSIQGEGRYTGCPAVFVRFSGCNLQCPFCDTDFKAHKEMTEDEICAYVNRIKGECKHVIFTGGEPTLQLTHSLCEKLHKMGCYLHIETNGKNKVLEEVDFVTCSPKFEYCKNAELGIDRIDELKVVYNGKNDMSLYKDIKATYRYLQPCDTGFIRENVENIQGVVEYCKKHPEWRVSVQTQKILKVR